MRYIGLFIAVVFSLSASAAEYVLALSWQPRFCATHADKPECPTQASRPPLSLHGLWPQEAEYCHVSPEAIAADHQHRWEALPQPALMMDTQTQLAGVMPGVISHLDRHEWTRHGSCSGADADTYFRQAIRLTEHVQQSRLATLLLQHAGQSVSLQELQNAARSLTGQRNIAEFLCEQQQLTEIRFQLQAGTIEQLRLDVSPLRPSRPTPRKSLCRNGQVQLAPTH